MQHSQEGRTQLISRVLAWCGGAYAELVADYPEERTRLATIGATVLMTGLLAGASSAYAIFTVFGSGPWVPLLAVAWALTIFNLDRLIVMTMQGGRRWGAAIPRLILAVVVAIVISHPLELWIFKDEISIGLELAERNAEEGATKKWKETVTTANQRYDVAVAATRTAASVDATQSALDKETANGVECARDQRKAADALNAEVNGTGGSRRHGFGPAARTANTLYLNVKSRCDAAATLATTARQALDAALQRQSGLVHALALARDEEIAKAETLRKNTLAGRASSPKDSLLGRHRQLFRLAFEDVSVLVISAFITLLFCLIETLPVFAKLMAKDSIYDDIVVGRREHALATGRGSREALADQVDAAKRAAVLRVELDREEAEAAARIRREAMEFHLASILSVTKAAREAWQPPPQVVDEALAASEKAARETVIANPVNRLRSVFAALESPARVAQPTSLLHFLVHTVLGTVGTVAAVAASYFLIARISPLNKVTLGLAIAVGAIVAGMFMQHSFSQFLSRFTRTKVEQE